MRKLPVPLDSIKIKNTTLIDENSMIKQIIAYMKSIVKPGSIMQLMDLILTLDHFDPLFSRVWH